MTKIKYPLGTILTTEYNNGTIVGVVVNFATFHNDDTLYFIKWTHNNRMSSYKENEISSGRYVDVVV